MTTFSHRSTDGFDFGLDDVSTLVRMAASKQRWWAQQKPPRWRKQICAALASGNRFRIGLAFALIRANGGHEHGTITQAADLFGLDHKLVSAQLSGSKSVTLDVLEAAADALGLPLSSFTSGAHPFAVPKFESDGFVEPGDDNWSTVYSAIRVLDTDSMLSEADLRKQFPRLFPDWCDQN